VVPARYFVTIVRASFLKGIGLRLLWGQVLFLAGILRPRILDGRAQDEAEAGMRGLQ